MYPQVPIAGFPRLCIPNWRWNGLEKHFLTPMMAFWTDEEMHVNKNMKFHKTEVAFSYINDINIDLPFIQLLKLFLKARPYLLPLTKPGLGKLRNSPFCFIHLSSVFASTFSVPVSLHRTVRRHINTHGNLRQLSFLYIFPNSFPLRLQWSRYK